MLTQPKTEQRIVCSKRGLLGAVCLGLVSVTLLCSVQQAQAAAKVEYGLVNSINQYRKQKGLPPIPLSQKLTTVALAHVEDLVNKQPHKNLCPSDPKKQNEHSWSNNPGKWKGGCYDGENKATLPIMWDKPKEITGYPTPGFEIFHSGSTADGALQGWKGSTEHNDVILNQNMWAGFPWKAIGAASYNGYYVVWFGTTLDTSKAPGKIAYLKDYDKTKTVKSMAAVLAIDPSKLKLAKAKTASKGSDSGIDADSADTKSATAKVVPSGSRESAGAHGRVYALDKSGKIVGNVSGATIELKNQAGAVVATITSGQNGYYKADLPAGQYFYKVTVAGYKDEDKGRGFTIQQSDQGHIYDFWLVKGPNDPQKQPPQIPIVEIGKLKGHVWEKTEKGELLGIPKAEIALRRDGSPQLAKVITRGTDKDGKQAGFYNVVIQTGSWRASVKAAGFETLVDPKPITIEAGKEVTQDFTLKRRPQKPPGNQGIKGIVRVHGSRLGQFPPDMKVEIIPVASAMSKVGAVAVDKKGGFRRDLLPGSYRAQATAKGYRPADSGVKFVFAGKYTMVELLLVPERTPEQPPEQPQEPDKPDETDRPSEMRLMLTVMEDLQQGRRPLPGAKLLVRRSNQGLGEAQRSTADKLGKAEFILKQPGPYVALAQAEGFQPSGIKFEAAAGADLSKTITLGRRETVPPIEQDPGTNDGHAEQPELVKVSGYVINEDESSPTGAFGVSGARLIWQRVGARGSRPQQVTTKDVGNFHLVLPEGDYRVGFKLRREYQPKAPELVKVRVGMDKKWFHALKVPQRIPDDEPIEPIPEDTDRPGEPQQVQVDVRGAVVVQSARGRGGYAGVPGAVVQWHPRGGRHAQAGTVRSGRGGAFSVRLGTGAYVAEVVPPQGYQGTTKVVRVHPGMEQTLLVLGRAADNIPDDSDRPGPDDQIVLPERPGNLTLSVQVFGREGRKTFPLGAAQIRISGQRQLFMTDRAGQLNVPLPAGRYNVMATKSGFNMAQRQVDLSRQNTMVRPIYLDRQPTGGGGEIEPPGEGQTPPPTQRSAPLQIRVMVSFPKPAKKNQPAGWKTTPAKSANIRITQGRRQVFSGRADNNGYLGTNLQPGSYQIQVSHGNLRHNETVNMGKQAVRRTITLQSSGALMTPTPGAGRLLPGIQDRNRIIPSIPLQRRVQ